MQLNRVEVFALHKLLQDDSLVAQTVISSSVRVHERVRTRAGFFSVLHLPRRLELSRELQERRWPFRLKRRKGVGYFVCWLEERSLCLEAVIERGECPADLVPELFT
ncbi:hypothetical protein H3221_000325 [Pseudomonas sp. LMG 31766]|jgi:hypothetical protein|uniref:Uncharacterized protein n=1 Tax=Pseudomonas chaetocerotis TaxID=2758695 RepID=A0A931D8E9_9PSED|nr:hypothetical protein [Pseudomonas chaetocerotis]MBZ9663188.1 hypothetical protein [Pseudomonas chaetocerotis]